jgi:hypothetical protein
MGTFGFIEKGIELLTKMKENNEVVSGVSMHPKFKLINPEYIAGKS